MTNKVTLETEFIIPEDMGEENVRHILNQFFGDLIRTDRFIDAKIVEEQSLDEAQRERLLQMLSLVNVNDMESLDNFIEEQTSSE